MDMSHRAFPHVVRDPRRVGGEPTIKGTRIPVRSVAVIYRLFQDVDDVCSAFPTASREAICEALEFYGEHQEEIDRYIEENEREAEASDFDQLDPEEIKKRMVRRG